MFKSVIRKSAVRIFTGIAFLSQLSSPAWSAAGGWYETWNSATAEARECNRPLIVLFEHEGCPDCEIMSEALSARTSRSALASAVKVRLEFDRNPEIVSRYNVSLTPTFLVLRPEDESLKEVYREVGSMSVSRIVQVGKSIKSIADNMPAVSSARKSEEEPAVAAASKPKTQTAPKKKAVAKRSSSVRTKKPAQKSAPAPSSAKPRGQSYYADPYAPRPAYEEPQRTKFWPFW